MISEEGSNCITKHLPFGLRSTENVTLTAEAAGDQWPCSEKELIGILEPVVVDQQQKELTYAQEDRKHFRDKHALTEIPWTLTAPVSRSAYCYLL